MALLKAAHCNKLKKSISFSCLLLGIKSELIKIFIKVFFRFIALAKFIET